MSFPTALPSYTITSGSETANGASGGLGLSGLLNAFEVDVTALGTKIGTGSATPTSGKILRGNGSGTSTWGQLVMASDVVAFSSADILGVVSDETGTGSLVFANTPTIVTPTIASFTNAQHNHSNAAGGGQIANTGISGVGTEKVANPYKFSVYRTAAYTSISAAATVYPFDTKLFDTGTNIDVVTNKGRFTAPVDGFYQFNGMINLASSATRVVVIFNKNGSELTRGTDGAGFGTEASPLVKLVANDFIEMTYFTASAIVTSVGVTGCHFSGYLVSTT